MNVSPVDATGVSRDPGCYLFRDGKGELLYVGKARNLRRRVSSYFTSSSSARRSLVKRINTVDTIITQNAREASVLENGLIAHHNPPHNRHLPERVGFWYLQLSDSEFPTLERVRPAQPADLAARHLFGPFESYEAADRISTFVTNRYGLQTCGLPRGQKRCVRFDLGHCIPVCEDAALSDRYHDAVSEAMAFFSDPRSGLNQIRDDLQRASDEMRFEDAAEHKSLLDIVSYALQPQDVERLEKHDRIVVFGDRTRAIYISTQTGRVNYVGEDYDRDPPPYEALVLNRSDLTLPPSLRDVPARVLSQEDDEWDHGLMALAKRNFNR